MISGPASLAIAGAFALGWQVYIRRDRIGAALSARRSQRTLDHRRDESADWLGVGGTELPASVFHDEVQ